MKLVYVTGVSYQETRFLKAYIFKGTYKSCIKSWRQRIEKLWDCGFKWCVCVSNGQGESVLVSFSCHPDTA